MIEIQLEPCEYYNIFPIHADNSIYFAIVFSVIFLSDGVYSSSQKFAKLSPICSLNSSGGTCEANEKKKCFEVLGLALELGAEFVDIELEVSNRLYLLIHV